MDQQLEPQPSSPAVTSYKNRRGWLVAFGIVEILIACFFFLMTAVIVFATYLLPVRPDQLPLPAGFTYLISAFYFILGAIFLSVGIGSISAKNWARIVMIILSSLWLVFGTLSTIGILLIMPAILRQQASMQQAQSQLSPDFMKTILIISGIFQGFIMVLLPLVFLLFYSGKNVKATCLAGRAGSVSGRSRPIPIVILLIWFSLATLSMVMVLPWLPVTALFGVFVHGALARLIFLSFAVIYAYCIWSFYKLQLAGWWVAIISSAFWLVSGIVTSLRLSPAQVYEATYKQMGIDSQQIAAYSLSQRYMGLLWISSLLIAGIFLALIFYTRRYFPARQPAS